ncbi:hypothetical protein ACFJGW_08140 [Burkholderiaceae bacterium UC74_6]
MHMPRRFDTALMVPPEGQNAPDEALLHWLRSWCEGGAFPVLSEPLRIVNIAPNAGLDTGLDAVACVLDGSHELARLGLWRGWLWRLQLLWRECVTGRGVRAEDPWDCGWWRDGAQDAAASFQPRRATLLMVRESDPVRVAELLSTLRAGSASYAMPVRVLVMSGQLTQALEASSR